MKKAKIVKVKPRVVKVRAVNAEKNDDVTNPEEARSGEAEETKEENNQAIYTSSTDASVNALKERLKQSEDQINIF